MKLGTETNSLINHIMSNTVCAEEITVGMGATFLSWTDRHPGTVIEKFVKGAFTYLKIRRDVVEHVKFECEEVATYEIVDGSDDNFELFRFKTDGSSGFMKVGINPDTGRYVKIGDGGLALGRREYYYDPSF